MFCLHFASSLVFYPSIPPFSSSSFLSFFQLAKKNQIANKLNSSAKKQNNKCGIFRLRAPFLPFSICPLQKSTRLLAIFGPFGLIWRPGFWPFGRVRGWRGGRWQSGGGGRRTGGEADNWSWGGEWGRCRRSEAGGG